MERIAYEEILRHTARLPYDSCQIIQFNHGKMCKCIHSITMNRYNLTRQALGVGATREALGGHKVAPFTSHAISLQRVSVEARNYACTHLLEYLAEVVCECGADPISDDVTVTSEVRL